MSWLRTTVFAPLLWWFDRTLDHFQLDDEEMFAGIIPVMKEVASRIHLEYCTEYRELEYEELGRQVFYTQHCRARVCYEMRRLEPERLRHI